MATKKTLHEGDAVTWDTSQGKTKGTVVKTETRSARAGGHTAKASREEPQFRVKSDKTGKEALHRPEALKKA